MTTTSLPAPQHTPNLYTEQSGRSWDLDRDFLDFHLHGWVWDGQPYASTAGPVLHAAADPGNCERLVALVCCSGLQQVPLDAPGDLAHLLDIHDVAFRACAGQVAR